MLRKIEKLLDEKVRPSLASHGGNIEVLDIDNMKVYVKLGGGCQGCSSSTATLKGGIEKLIKETFPEIQEVIDMTDHDGGEKPYM